MGGRDTHGIACSSIPIPSGKPAELINQQFPRNIQTSLWLNVKSRNALHITFLYEIVHQFKIIPWNMAIPWLWMRLEYHVFGHHGNTLLFTLRIKSLESLWPFERIPTHEHLLGMSIFTNSHDQSSFKLTMN